MGEGKKSGAPNQEQALFPDNRMISRGTTLTNVLVTEVTTRQVLKDQNINSATVHQTFWVGGNGR